MFHVLIVVVAGMTPEFQPTWSVANCDGLRKCALRYEPEPTERLPDVVEPATSYSATSVLIRDPTAAVLPATIEWFLAPATAVGSPWGGYPKVGVAAMHPLPFDDTLLSYDDRGDPMPVVVVTSQTEALDALTRELLVNAAGGELDVLWLFDRTASMRDDRDPIGDTLASALQEFDLSTAAARTSHTVAEFSAELQMLTVKPQRWAGTVAEAWRSVTEDDTGIERCSMAVIELLRRVALQSAP